MSYPATLDSLLLKLLRLQSGGHRGIDVRIDEGCSIRMTLSTMWPRDPVTLTPQGAKQPPAKSFLLQPFLRCKIMHRGDNVAFSVLISNDHHNFVHWQELKSLNVNINQNSQRHLTMVKYQTILHFLIYNVSCHGWHLFSPL